MSVFALIPGSGGSGWYFHRLAAILTDRGHQAIPIDLPAADPRADFDAYVDACRTVLADVRSDDLIVVGQSLGGFTAPLVAEQLAAPRLVFVNAMIPEPGESPRHWFATTGPERARIELADVENRDSTTAFDPMRDFFHDVPADVVTDAMALGEPEQSEAIMACRSAFSSLPPSVTVISGRDDRFFPLPFQQRIARQRLGVEPMVIPGGHLVALARPDALADALIGSGSR